MSSEERTPENKKSIKGSKNEALQGDNNQVIRGNNNIFLAFFNIFSSQASSQPSSGRKEPMLDWRTQYKWRIMGTLAFFTMASAAGIIYILKPKEASNVEGISLGEEILIEQNIPNKQELERAFLSKDYQQFRELLRDYLKQHPNSPELWVYWNNAKAALLSKKPMKIAVSIPIGTNPDVAEEILRGVALAQNEINDDSNQNGINGQFLQIVIANDNNDSELAEKVAKSFVQDPSILAVVGHNASNASIAAKAIYTGKLVLITPTSFSDKIQGDSYIFRMVPQISYFANKLARYIEQENPNSIVGTCADPGAPDNDSFIAQFDAVFPKKSFRLSCNFLNEKLTDDSLDKAVTNILEEIKHQKINSLVLAPYINRLPQISKIFQTIHSNNLSIRLYGSPTFFTDKTLEAGQAAEGLTLSVPWYPKKNEPKNVQFQQKFKQLYQTTIEKWRTAMAYDATWITATGLERISKEEQERNREQLNKALRGESYSEKKSYPKFTYDGATGKTIFSDGGVNENKSDVIIQIQNSQFVPIPKK